MTFRPSGFYWCYTLDTDGRRIESDNKPSIVFYNSDMNTLALLGYDTPVEYRWDVYELVRKIEFKEKAHGQTHQCN